MLLFTLEGGFFHVFISKKTYVLKFYVHASVRIKKLLYIHMKTNMIVFFIILWIEIGYRFGPNLIYIYCGVLFCCYLSNISLLSAFGRSKIADFQSFGALIWNQLMQKSFDQISDNFISKLDWKLAFSCSMDQIKQK